MTEGNSPYGAAGNRRDHCVGAEGTVDFSGSARAEAAQTGLIGWTVEPDCPGQSRPISDVCVTSGKLLNLSVPLLPHLGSGFWHPAHILQAFGKEVRSWKRKISEKRLVFCLRDQQGTGTQTHRQSLPGTGGSAVTRYLGSWVSPGPHGTLWPGQWGTLPFYCPFRVFGEKGEQEMTTSSFWLVPHPTPHKILPHHLCLYLSLTHTHSLCHRHMLTLALRSPLLAPWNLSLLPGGR